MDFDLFMFWAVLAFVLSVWLLMLNQWGHVQNVTDGGFTFKPLMGSRIDLAWKDVKPPIKIHRDFLPRILLSLASAKFTSVRPSLAVLLRFTADDQAFVEQMQSRFGLREIRSIGDLF